MRATRKTHSLGSGWLPEVRHPPWIMKTERSSKAQGCRIFHYSITSTWTVEESFDIRRDGHRALSPVDKRFSLTF